MLPENTYSSVPVGGLFLTPDERITSPLIDWERGGVDLLDASQGMDVQNWTCYTGDQYNVFVKPENGVPTLLFQDNGIEALSFCFDQNMRWSVAYIKQGILTLRWFDSSSNGRVVSEFGPAQNPKMTLDDKRTFNILNSDMLLAYIRGSSLYYRQQRDRFQIEYTLRTGLFPNTKLKNIGMADNFRVQFELV